MKAIIFNLTNQPQDISQFVMADEYLIIGPVDQRLELGGLSQSITWVWERLLEIQNLEPMKNMVHIIVNPTPTRIGVAQTIITFFEKAKIQTTMTVLELDRPAIYIAITEFIRQGNLAYQEYERRASWIEKNTIH